MFLHHINFLACYLHSQKCQFWVLDSNQLILSNSWTERDVRLPLLLISHAKELIVSKMTLRFQKKKWLLFLPWKDIFETEKTYFFYWLLSWQHIKSVYLECRKTKEPYVGPISYCQIGPIFLQFWQVLSYIFRSLSPIFLYFWTPKALDTLYISSILTKESANFGFRCGPFATVLQKFTCEPFIFGIRK